MPEEKTCKIDNDCFSWIMYVDGRTINFDLADNADYFEKLYRDLGYKVIRNDNKWKERQHV